MFPNCYLLIFPSLSSSFKTSVGLVSEDPAETSRPSASFTVRALTSLEPSFAKDPVMVTMSPFFTE